MIEDRIRAISHLTDTEKLPTRIIRSALGGIAFATIKSWQEKSQDLHDSSFSSLILHSRQLGLEPDEACGAPDLWPFSASFEDALQELVDTRPAQSSGLDLESSLCGEPVLNPITLASGPIGADPRRLIAMAKQRVGILTTKTLLLEERLSCHHLCFLSEPIGELAAAVDSPGLFELEFRRIVSRGKHIQRALASNLNFASVASPIWSKWIPEVLEGLIDPRQILIVSIGVDTSRVASEREFVDRMLETARIAIAAGARFIEVNSSCISMHSAYRKAALYTEIGQRLREEFPLVKRLLKVAYQPPNEFAEFLRTAAPPFDAIAGINGLTVRTPTKHFLPQANGDSAAYYSVTGELIHDFAQEAFKVFLNLRLSDPKLAHLDYIYSGGISNGKAAHDILANGAAAVAFQTAFLRSSTFAFQIRRELENQLLAKLDRFKALQSHGFSLYCQALQAINDYCEGDERKVMLEKTHRKFDEWNISLEVQSRAIAGRNLDWPTVETFSGHAHYLLTSNQRYKKKGV